MKKAMLLSISMVLIFAIVMTTGLITLIKKDRDLAKEKRLGEAQLELIKAYSQGEKAVLYIEQASGLAIEESIRELVENGMYAASPCGSGGNTLREGSDSYVLWQNKGRLCYPTKEAIEEGLGTFFNAKIHSYSSIYPEKNVRMPASFRLTINNSTIFITTKDHLIVGLPSEELPIISGDCGNRIVSIALKEHSKNIVESPVGSNCGLEIDKYQDNSGCEMWCADFVSWVYKEAGYSFDVDSYWRIASALGVKEYFEKNELFIPSGSGTPLPGDVIIFDNSRAGSVNHVGIVERADAERVYTIEGNSNNRVNKDSYLLEDKEVVGYGRLKNCKTMVAGNTVVLDPGHGTKNNHGTSGEADIVMEVTEKIQQLLQSAGVNVLLTHEKTDNSEELGANQEEDNIHRARIANENNAALFFRIHADAADGKAAIYYPEAKPSIADESKKAADIIWNRALPIVKSSKVKYSEGLLTDAQTAIGGQQGGLLTGSKASEVPTALIELVPLNSQGRSWINQETNQQAYAQAIADGIIEYIGTAAK